MKKNAPAAARRYARALFEAAQARGAGAAESVNQTLKPLAALLRANRELSAVLADPTVAGAAKKKILRAVASDGGESLALQFLDILIDQGRSVDAPAVADAFEDQLFASRNIARARVVSAAPLAAGELAALVAALEKLTGKGVAVEPRVDAALVGGIVVSIAGLTYDGSVQAQLRALRTRLSGHA